MASAEERGGAAPAPAPAASPPPYEETYDEYLARQYAQNNVYSTGTEAAPVYAWGQAGVDNAAPPPPESGLPTQQETLDYYGSQSINDYGPPPQPAYVATNVGPGASPPPPLPTLPEWASTLREPIAQKVVKELPMGGLWDAVLTRNYGDYGQGTPPPPVAMAPSTTPGVPGSTLPRPPGWMPGTVAPAMETRIVNNTAMELPNYVDGFSPVERAWNVFDGDYRQYRNYWNQREYGPGPQWQVNKEGRRHDRRIEKRNDRRNS